MFKQMLALGIATIAMSAPLADAGELQPLEVGMDAPALTDVTWIKGSPVSEWESGKVYVLDFWATWCGPCVQAIPHMTEVQHKYESKGVTVIGMAIWPRNGMTPTAEYVKVRGDEMGYSVAEDIDRKTATAFMEASGQGGIPTVMIVDKDGKLAWIGHPMAGMDAKLDWVLSPEYDLKKATENAKAAKIEMEKLENAFREQNWDGIASAAERLLEIDSNEFGTVGGMYKYLALVKGGHKDKAAAWGAELVTDRFADDAQTLNMFAWTMVQPDGLLAAEEVDSKLAVQAAEAAIVLDGGKDANSLDTLARAYFVNGDYAKAAETQQKAVDFADNPAMKQAFEEALATYKSKAATQG